MATQGPRKANGDESRRIEALGRKLRRFAEREVPHLADASALDDASDFDKALNIAFLLISATLYACEESPRGAVAGVMQACGNYVAQAPIDELPSILEGAREAFAEGMSNGSRLFAGGQA